MGLLKAEISKKRQRLEEDIDGKRFFKQKRELEAKAQCQATAPNSASASGSSATKSNSNSASASSFGTTSSNTAASKSLTDEQNIDKMNLPKQKPIILFGEDGDARLDRLKYVLKAGLFEVDSDIMKGRTNDFLHGEGGVREDNLSADGCSSGIDADKDLKRMKTNFEELFDEDKILVFFNKLLNEWNQELREMPDVERRTAKGKSMVDTFKKKRKKKQANIIAVVMACKKGNYGRDLLSRGSDLFLNDVIYFSYLSETSYSKIIRLSAAIITNQVIKSTSSTTKNYSVVCHYYYQPGDQKYVQYSKIIWQPAAIITN
ncbi:unnamed protein product [Malus baccata var. baccata]